MKTRKEVVELVQKQLTGMFDSNLNKYAWHYGIVELRELLDFIYEGPPETEEEFILKQED